MNLFNLFRISCLCFYLLINSNVSHAEEAILSYHSDITINESGLIDVVEHISVYAKGWDIKRGIYRDFPTQYFGPLMTKRKVPFDVISVKRNGKASPYHTEKLNNGIRIYIGSSNFLLPKGQHDYQIHYQTDNQLGYFTDYDEFYWNVTGTGWQFPIYDASVNIKLPNNGHEKVLSQQFWTGYQGQTDQNARINNQGELLGFTMTQGLSAHQGLTIGLKLPKGVFLPPKKDPFGFIADNLAWLLTGGLFLFYLSYFIRAWHHHGRDPKAGVIIPRFEAPKGLSPAAVRYIDKELIDEKSLTAAILSLATKGFVTIKQTEKLFKIKPKDRPNKHPLSRGERNIKSKLFGRGNHAVHLKKKYHSKVASAKISLTKALKDEYKEKCFVDNWDKISWGWVISLFLSYFFFYTLYGHIMGGFVLFFMMLFACFFAGMFIVIIVGAPWLLILVVLGLIGSYVELSEWFMTHWLPCTFVGLIFFGNLLFAYLLRAPTLFGRQLKDQIEGLKLYLRTAEVNRLNLLHPPEQNLSHYEALLPYAIALNLENAWGERFSLQLAEATEKDGYQPTWYHGTTFKSGTFSNNISSLTRGLSSTVSTAMTTPSSSGSSGGSSSGGFSSGGGFSGGGGGGGGGGGW
ncbi:DUF2207 domain-containing protein [Marinicella rhabdoformis]|uniref:DUF2207 domain-containing protein n=1 Tax=Marinicella rhabdoformis TaxID=2580566 RepID=UPI0012AED1DD|nr:DUF2207 domain-containing protein [Marinicella rhabdoformis]